MKNHQNENVSNIYNLDGTVPIMKAIPFGLQHILAMFVSNLTPITIIAAAGGLKQAEIAILLQNAMFGRNRNFDSAISSLENRFQTSHRYGSKFYLCNYFKYCCR